MSNRVNLILQFGHFHINPEHPPGGRVETDGLRKTMTAPGLDRQGYISTQALTVFPRTISL